jgi:uracil-DNA glycosylase family 4
MGGPDGAAPVTASGEPASDCPFCPRLVAYREANRARYANFHNAPVPSFGNGEARLLIVGLAPGLKGANQTGRPFTGDYAGDLLYETLGKFGFARGAYGRRADDRLQLIDCRVTNAVRCVPPENKPTTEEIRTCRAFLAAELAGLARLRVVLALGTIAHGAVLAALGEKKSRFPFVHGALHQLPNGLLLADSYHCSRYNTNTGRLTVPMFEAVFAELRARAGST